jgi:hypothetical protein
MIFKFLFALIYYIGSKRRVNEVMSKAIDGRLQHLVDEV